MPKKATEPIITRADKNIPVKNTTNTRSSVVVVKKDKEEEPAVSNGIAKFVPENNIKLLGDWYKKTYDEGFDLSTIDTKHHKTLADQIFSLQVNDTKIDDLKKQNNPLNKVHIEQMYKEQEEKLSLVEKFIAKLQGYDKDEKNKEAAIDVLVDIFEGFNLNADVPFPFCDGDNLLPKDRPKNGEIMMEHLEILFQQASEMLGFPKAVQSAKILYDSEKFLNFVEVLHDYNILSKQELKKFCSFLKIYEPTFPDRETLNWLLEESIISIAEASYYKVKIR